MLQYMRKIWREEYWASDDIDHIHRCGKMVRAVDFQNPRGEVVGYVDVPVLRGARPGESEMRDIRAVAYRSGGVLDESVAPFVARELSPSLQILRFTMIKKEN